MGLYPCVTHCKVYTLLLWFIPLSIVTKSSVVCKGYTVKVFYLFSSKLNRRKRYTYFALFRANHKPISKAFCLVCGFWFALKRKTIEYTHNSEN
nr:MAG TPA: hypothetical protein [Caudoviricetes sp.]